jgi:hypothetical protein
MFESYTSVESSESDKPIHIMLFVFLCKVNDGFHKKKYSTGAGVSSISKWKFFHSAEGQSLRFIWFVLILLGEPPKKSR